MGLELVWVAEGDAACGTRRALRRRRSLGSHVHRAMLTQLRFRGELHSTRLALDLLSEERHGHSIKGLQEKGSMPGMEGHSKGWRTIPCRRAGLTVLEGVRTPWSTGSSTR